MGGSGSGNWYRWDKKDSTADYLSLSINFMVQKAGLKAGVWQNGTVKWSRGEVERSNISYEMNTLGDTPYIRPQYTNKSSGEKFDYRIPLVTTRPNYGGIRWWFQCPCCSRRVGVLFLSARYLACRHCYNLAYESQREDWTGRYLRKAQKIHDSLGGKGAVDWVPKPKGMHWKTYTRKLEEMKRYENVSLAGVCKKLGIATGGEWDDLLQI